MDDDDERLTVWKSSMKMAENDIYASIQQAQVKRQQEAIRFLAEHERSVKEFGEVWAKERENPDYDAIYKYADDDKNGYAAKLSEQEKILIRNAAIRVGQQIASPQDMYIVRKYYEEAKADFYKNGMGKGGGKKTPTAPKKAYPRSGEITGGADVGGVTVEQLQTMLNTKEWNEIPQAYRNKLLGIS